MALPTVTPGVDGTPPPFVFALLLEFCSAEGPDEGAPWGGAEPGSGFLILSPPAEGNAVLAPPLPDEVDGVCRPEGKRGDRPRAWPDDELLDGFLSRSEMARTRLGVACMVDEGVLFRPEGSDSIIWRMRSGSFLHERKGTVTTLDGRPFAPGRIPVVEVLACFLGRSFRSPPSISSLLRFLSALGRFSAGLAVPFDCWLDSLGTGGGVPSNGVEHLATATGCTAIESAGGAVGTGGAGGARGARSAGGAGEATRGAG